MSKPEYREPLEENISRIAEDPEAQEDLASNVAAIADGWRRLWERTGDAKKRRVIMAALVNSFDKDAYEEGLTLRLFQILDELDYGEIRFLFRAFSGISATQGTLTKNAVSVPESLERYHAERLIEHKILLWPGFDASSPTDRNASVGNARVTRLGERLKRLIGERAIE